MMKIQKLLAHSMLVMVVALAPLAAHADQLWNWTYDSVPTAGDAGAVAVASGTLTTAGTGSGFQEILSLTGVYNGVDILGLTALGTNSYFTYDNTISSDSPHFGTPGMMFTVAGSNDEHNIWFTSDANNGAGLYQDGFFSNTYHITYGTFTLTAATAVPELSIYLLLLAGLAVMGVAAKRRLL